MHNTQPSRGPIRSGLVGIARKIQKDNVATKKQMSEAFQDIHSLMESAKPMVELVHKISDCMKDVQGDEVPEDEIKDFRQNLLSLGVKVKDPVTKSKFGKDEYFRKLAKEISDTLSGEIEKRGGILTLIEVFVRLNRARGVKLASPEDLLHACYNLEKEKLPLKLKEYGKGVRVLQHDCFSDDVCKSTVLSLLDVHEWLSSEKYAELTGIPLLVSRHVMSMCEENGLICRDESIEGLRFYTVDRIKFQS